MKEVIDPKGRIRIVIANDHESLRDAMRELLSRSEDLEVVAEAANGEEAIELVEQLDPDILLLDLEMPVSGFETLRRLHGRGPIRTKVIAISGSDDKEDFQEAARLGAIGTLYVLDVFRELGEVIRRINGQPPEMSSAQ